MQINSKIKALLEKRGIDTEEKLEEFFSDKPKETYDPFLLPDMEEGVDLILSAIEDGKKICIYGDYDCDGVTSTVILSEVLQELTDNVIQYIPSRFDEGYGLNIDAIDKIIKAGTDLLITVDLGSVSVDEVEYAKDKGLDVVVTDHHRIEDRKADTILINPARKDSKYPFRYLAGCGVAFKLAQAIADTMGLDKRVITSKLDLVALGTIGDIVPLISENRMLAKYGLRAINTSNREALRILIEKVGLKPGEITAENVSYILVPHINAAGRMRSATLALKLFLAKDRKDMEEYADRLVECNAERRRLQEDIFRRACDKVGDDDKQDLIMTYLEDAHEGVAGIAAGKLKEKYKVPAIIVTDTESDKLKGTGRSPEGIDLYDLLKHEEKWFTAFGGHAAACGFTMKKEGFDEVREDLEKYAHALRTQKPELFEAEIKEDIDLEPNEADQGFVEQLEMMEPCGCSNERPLIAVTGRPSDLYDIGKDGKFIKFRLSKAGRAIDCIVFSNVDDIRKMVKERAGSGEEIAAIGILGKHAWNGNVSIQLNVSEVR